MFIIFIVFSIIISISVFLIRKNTFTILLSTLFLLSIYSIIAYAYLHAEAFDSMYYKFDSLGLLMSLVLGILSLATFYHSRLFLKRHQFSARQEAIYYASLIMLITAMMSAYFAENIAVLWVSI